MRQGINTKTNTIYNLMIRASLRETVLMFSPLLAHTKTGIVYG